MLYKRRSVSFEINVKSVLKFTTINNMIKLNKILLYCILSVFAMNISILLVYEINLGKKIKH